VLPLDTVLPGASLTEINNSDGTYYDKNLRRMALALCFNTSDEDATNTVFMTLGDDLVHSKDYAFNHAGTVR
jgi:hypothetical protein